MMSTTVSTPATNPMIIIGTVIGRFPRVGGTLMIGLASRLGDVGNAFHVIRTLEDFSFNAAVRKAR